MTKQLVLAQSIKGSWKATGDNGLSATKTFSDADEPSGSMNFASGIAAGQCNTLFRSEISLAAAGTVSIDLLGGTGEKDVLNNALSFAKVRYVRLILTTPPAVGVSLKLGPQNVTNGWLGPWNVATATGFNEVRDKFEMSNPVEGWVVGSTNKILKVANPSAVAVTAVLEIFGTDA